MNWKEKDNLIEKNYSFKTFKEAINFVNAIANISEKVNHHPEIFIHDYNQVRVQITTHDAKMITDKDKNLADLIDLI